MRRRSVRWIGCALVFVTAAAAVRADEDQRRAAATLKRMDSVATAIEAYMTDQDTAPDATSVEALRSMLTPTYIKDLPTGDAWDTPFRYVKTGRQSFQIISAGSDRKFDEKSWSVQARTTDLAADAVYARTKPDVPGTFHRVWISSLGAPLALTTDEGIAAAQVLARVELAKMKGMSEEESWSYLRISSTRRSMLSLGVFIEVYKKKNAAYPAAKSMRDLAEILFPGAAADIDTKDGWGTELRYVVSNDGKNYKLISAGADRTFNETSWDKPDTLASADDDAVIRNGEWIRAWDEHTRPGESAESRRRKTLKPPARALLERADALHAAGDDAGALEAYMDAVKADPAAADLAAIGRYAPLQYFVTAPPPPPPPGRPTEKESIDKVSRAQSAALRQYLQLRPGDWDATRALVRLVDLPEAESLLQPFFKARPRDPELYVARGGVRALHRRYSAAIDDYAKASELDPQNAERYYVLGVVAYGGVARDEGLTPDQKRELIRRGLAAFDRAEALRADYVESMTYRNLLLRQQALLEKDPEVQKKLTAEADAVRQRAIEIIKQRRGARHEAEGAGSSVAPPREDSSNRSSSPQEPLKVGDDVKAPVVIHRVPPIYPEEAKKHGVSSIVIMETVIDKSGRVVRATVLKPVPYGGSEAALAAVKQWTFKPGTRNGEPVDVIFNVTVKIAPADNEQ